MEASRQSSAPIKKRWPRWAKAFLACLAKDGVVGYAAKRAGIDRDSAYVLRKNDPAFRAAWAIAMNEAIDLAEKEAWRRGIKGTRKPVYQGGEKVGHIQEYSDTLLIFMLKAHRPKKFRERYDMNVKGRVDVVNWDALAQVIPDGPIPDVIEAEIVKSIEYKPEVNGKHEGNGVA